MSCSEYHRQSMGQYARHETGTESFMACAVGLSCTSLQINRNTQELDQAVVDSLIVRSTNWSSDDSNNHLL